MGNLDCKFFYNHNFTKIKEKMKKLFLDSVFWKSPGKTHFHSEDCSISVHSTPLRSAPCSEKEQSSPWKWFYLTFSRKLHKKLLYPDLSLTIPADLSIGLYVQRLKLRSHNSAQLLEFGRKLYLIKSCQIIIKILENLISKCF